MSENKKISIIIDTNIFISFLIGKSLSKLKYFLVNDKIELIIADQNIEELLLVTGRPKFTKYFNKTDVQDFIKFLYTIGKVVEIKNEPQICRDPKDNFLLGLAESSEADYLISGDDDLLIIKNYKNTKILTIREFEELLEN